MNVSDYQSSSYVDIFDALNAVDISLRYGTDSWTQVFGGIISSAAPQLSMQGEVLQVGAWGDGNCLVKTACDENYGLESLDNHTVDTPKEILEDIIDEHVNKIFGAAAAANWNLGKAVDNAHAGLSVTHYNSNYLNNFVNINRICDLTTAYAAQLGQVGTHWYVNTTPALMFKKIDADHSGGAWDRYWGGMTGTDPGTSASSTIVVAEDMILYNFRKHIDDYANDVLVSGKWRMPGADHWCEQHGGVGGSALWGSGANMSVTDSGTSHVGGTSILLEPTDAVVADEAYYPAGQNMSLDLSKPGSPNTVPTLGFYARKNEDIGTSAVWIHSAANNHITPYSGLNTLIPDVDTWTYIQLPVGPHFGSSPLNCRAQMTQIVNPIDWTDVDYIRFTMPADVSNDLYIDDLHFSGVVVREAKDTSEIGPPNNRRTYMKVIQNDTALDDTLTSGTPGTTDVGTLAQLTYAELLRRSQTPTVGIIQIPLAITLLPGQTMHIHACQQASGAYRVDMDMRVVEVQHLIGEGARFGGFETRLNLTSDVSNSHALGAPTMIGLLKQYAGALGHGEARDLKGGALDNQIPRLTESY